METTLLNCLMKNAKPRVHSRNGRHQPQYLKQWLLTIKILCRKQKERLKIQRLAQFQKGQDQLEELERKTRHLGQKLRLVQNIFKQLTWPLQASGWKDIPNGTINALTNANSVMRNLRVEVDLWDILLTTTRCQIWNIQNYFVKVCVMKLEKNAQWKVVQV